MRAPLIVLCHGCKQTREEFAKGTRITALADQLGCLVLMPRQANCQPPTPRQAQPPKTAAT